MLNIMTQAKNAIEAYNKALEATSSNIANMNVAGYKRVEVSFQSTLNKAMSQGSAARGNLGGTNPQQFGSGMKVSSSNIDFTSGDLIDGSSLDLAISGQGLFIVSSDGGTTYRYTKAGNFGINGYKLTSNGMVVYGLDASNNLVPIDLSSIEDGSKENYKWEANSSGAYTLMYTKDPTATTPSYVSTGYKIALASFPNQSGLAQAEGTTFAETMASGTPATAIAGTPATIQNKKLEQSNVFYLSETIDAVELERAMNGNLTILQMASQMITQFINKLS